MKFIEHIEKNSSMFCSELVEDPRNGELRKCRNKASYVVGSLKDPMCKWHANKHALIYLTEM